MAQKNVFAIPSTNKKGADRHDQHVLSLDECQRTQLDREYDSAYANYWLAEYGTDPDDIRMRHLFPAIGDLIMPARAGSHRRVIYDFGCGTGNAILGARDWYCKKYVGIDVNSDLLSAAYSKYENNGFGKEAALMPSCSFIRRNFDQAGWQVGLERGFDVGLSLFVINELKDPHEYLRGIVQLRGKRTSEQHQSKLIIAITHPTLLLKDLSDFYQGRANSRKFEGVESYRGNDLVGGQYRFTRGDFSARFRQYSIEELWKALEKAKMKVERVKEIFYSSPGANESRDLISKHYPKILLLKVGFRW